MIMLKIIFKNLWNRRRANAWIFAELILITILSWVIIDDAAVGLHDRYMPLGYDADRVVNVEISTLPRQSKLYREEYADSAANADAYRALLGKASRLPMVECSARVHMHINDQGTSIDQLSTGNPAVDTLAGYTYSIMFPAGEKPLSAYGVEAAEGSPSIEELENRTFSEGDQIITESVDRAYWPDRRGIHGKRFIMPYGENDTISLNVVGIIKDIRYQTFTRTGGLAFQCWDPEGPSANKQFSIVLRLKEGVNSADYVNNYVKTINTELREGNYYVTGVNDQLSLISSVEDSRGLTAKRYMNFALAALFLTNLILGVTGCVWLQTGKRVKEMGVLRSFGAGSGQLIRMLIGESIVMATIAFAIGDLIFLQYAVAEGLNTGHGNNVMFIDSGTWVENFGAHFAIVSAIVYAIIIVCVVIGTYFPARHAANINPVDALRDE